MSISLDQHNRLIEKFNKLTEVVNQHTILISQIHAELQLIKEITGLEEIVPQFTNPQEPTGPTEPTT